MPDRKTALELAVAGGLVLIGVAASAPVTGLVAVGVAGGIGGNWAAQLAMDAYRRWTRNWLTDAGVLNTELSRALAHAFQETFRQMATDYAASQAYKRLATRESQAATLAAQQLDLLADEVGALFRDASRLHALTDGAAHDLLRQSYGDADNYPSRPDYVRRELADTLADWLYGHDAGLIEFVRGYADSPRLDELSLRFFDRLRRDDAEGTAAWRAWQQLQLQSSRGALDQMDGRLANVEAATSWLTAWAERIERTPAAGAELTGLDQLPANIAALHAAMAASFQQTQAALDDLPERVRPILRQELDRTPGGRASHIPRPPAATRLFGRDRFLDDLADALAASDPARVALVGMAGVGKTALALALANHSRLVEAFPDGRAWLSFGPTPDLFNLLGVLLAQFGQPADHLTDEEMRAAALRNVLAERRVLLVLDDLWSVDAALPFVLASQPPTGLVLTSRRAQIVDDLDLPVREVRVLEPSPSLEMLASAGDPAASAVAAAATTSEMLAEALGHLPHCMWLAASSTAWPVPTARRGPWRGCTRHWPGSSNGARRRRGRSGTLVGRGVGAEL